MLQPAPCLFPAIYSFLALPAPLEGRARHDAEEREAHMNSSSSFFAGILWTALLAPSVAAFPHAQNNQAAPAKQSSIVFSGTVSQLAATSFAGVPQSQNTIVVRVDSVLKKPPAVSLKKGDNVTVELKDPSAFQQGTQATFYTEGWIFGSGVAVKELGHDFNPAGASAPAAARAEPPPAYPH